MLSPILNIIKYCLSEEKIKIYLFILVSIAYFSTIIAIPLFLYLLVVLTKLERTQNFDVIKLSKKRIKTVCVSISIVTVLAQLGYGWSLYLDYKEDLVKLQEVKEKHDETAKQLDSLIPKNDTEVNGTTPNYYERYFDLNPSQKIKLDTLQHNLRTYELIETNLSYSGAKASHKFQDRAFISATILAAVIAYYFLFLVLFYKPILNSESAIQSKLSTKVKSNEVEIIKSEKLKTYSVADELTKWVKLKDDGEITIEEFNRAKKRLLNSD